MTTADVLLIGRETYDSFAGAWPGREAAGGDDAPFARQLGDVRKVVVSRQRLEFSRVRHSVTSAGSADMMAAAGIRGRRGAQVPPTRSPMRPRTSSPHVHGMA